MRFVSVLILTLALLVGSSSVYGDVINVPDDFETIQDAISDDGTEDGDTVRVAPGEYVANINFSGKNIVVMGKPEDPSEVDIDGNENASVVTFNNEETEAAVLTGFTITNGSGQYSDIIEENTGGGIMVDHASPTLRNLVISNNAVDPCRAYSWGGGVALYFSNSTLENIDIWENTAGAGGGLCMYLECALLLRDVTVHNNRAIIQENQWGSSGAGGGIVCNANTIFERCVVSDNSAERFGGGIFFGDGHTATIQNLTVTRNTAPQGAGLFIQNLFEAELVNTICWANEGNEIQFRSDTGRSSLSVRYSDIEGGRDGIVGDNGDVEWGEGNIDADPLFVDPDEGDFHLTEDSPCIDTGDPDSADDPDGTRADMGAFYFHQEQQEAGLEIDWMRTYGGEGIDRGHTLIQTENGGFAILGMTQSFGGGDSDPYLVVTDGVGELLWDQFYNDNRETHGYSIIQLPDVGFSLAGAGPWPDRGGFWIAEVNGDGEFQWDECFDGLSVCSDHVMLDDNGYIMVGYTENNANGRSDAYVTRTNENGELIWERRYHHSICDGINRILLTDGGNFVGAAWTSYAWNDNSQLDAMLVKFDEDGNLLWLQTYEVEDCNAFFDIVATPDGGYMMAGWSGEYIQYPDGDVDYYVVKVNSDGDLDWSRTYGGDNWDRCKSVIATSDGNYLLTGSTNSFTESGMCDIWLIKINVAGDSLDSWVLPIEDEQGMGASTDVIQLEDGSYVISGWTGIMQENGNIQEADVLLLKTARDQPRISWRINIAASVGDYNDSGTNYAGGAEDADWDFDENFDIPEPPHAPRNFVQIYFPHEDWEHDLFENFTTDVVPEDGYVDNTIIWEIEVNTDQEDEDVTLTFTPEDLPDEDLLLVMEDVDGDILQDLREEDTYEYNSEDGGINHFRLYYGRMVTVTVTYPEGGELFEAGDNVNINWEAESCLGNIESSTVYLSTDAGETWEEIGETEGDEFELEWEVPDLYSPCCLIKAECRDEFGASESDETDELFGITPTRLEHESEAGWSMLSVPLIPADPEVEV